jgi:ribonuclease R
MRRNRRPLAVGKSHAPEAGDYVIAEYPWDQEKALLVEVLGREDDPKWDNQGVLSRHRWPTRFSRAVEEEAARARAPERVAGHREDLRDRVTFTMDPDDAADFDDALSWRPLSGGRGELGVHIADVSYYVPVGSAIDQEAQERTTSVYLAGMAVPMLPERLSSDLCSLVPGKPRYTLSVLAEMDEKGGVSRYRVVEGLIQSHARLTYGQGQRILDGEEGPDPEVTKGLRTLGALAEKLFARRIGRGALDLDVPEVRVTVAADGRPVSLERRERKPAHRVVEEFMLLANTLVGEEAERRGGPFLFRVHEPPPITKLSALEVQLRALGLPALGGSEAPISRSLQRLVAFPLPPEKRRLVHQLVLRAMSRAAYRESDAGHFGLATRSYCHFTSPIRRYPDLFNHRQVRHWLTEPAKGAGRAAWVRRLEEESRRLEERWREGLPGLARHCSDNESVAMDSERESVRIKSLRFLEPHLGEEYEGTIVGVVPRGVFVDLDEIPIDGFCRVSDAIDDDFRMDEAGVRLIGRRSRRRFSLGDKLRVLIARIDVPGRELELSLIAPRAHRPRARGKGTKMGRMM